jgi:nicotinamide mononucleotide transporter
MLIFPETMVQSFFFQWFVTKLNLWYKTLFIFRVPTMIFDLIGALVSFISTYYFIKMNNKAWPIGMIATILNGWLYWHKGIYADMLLEVFYFLSLSYGWYKWKYQLNQLITNDNSSLGYLKPSQWVSLGLVLGLVFISIYYLLQTLTHSTVAVLDATTTSLSLVAQWLMCHKIIVTWVLWFITDVLYATMYMSKNLPFHCLLMIIYTGMAVTGYRVWARKYKAASTASPMKEPLNLDLKDQTQA